MESWFVNSHCYTVLALEGEGGTVKLCTPWAHHPEPDGIFALPVGVFLPAFYGIVTSGLAPKVD